jgi:DNA-binding response OmpR family regulator
LLARVWNAQVGVVHSLLLIEPSESTATPIRALLEQNDFLVDVVHSVAEARDLSKYALLVVDMRRGDHEGMQFVQRLHREESHLVGRIVVISADDGHLLEQELHALDVCDVVPKPVNAEEILRAVFECLEKNPAGAVH